MNTREWYDKTVAFARNEAATFQREANEYANMSESMRDETSYMVAYELSNIAQKNVEIMNDLVKIFENMYNKEEEEAEYEAWLSDHAAGPDDYDPHPCAEQLWEDRIIADSYPCRAWRCGMCGETHLEIVDSHRW